MRALGPWQVRSLTALVVVAAQLELGDMPVAFAQSGLLPASAYEAAKPDKKDKKKAAKKSSKGAKSKQPATSGKGVASTTSKTKRSKPSAKSRKVAAGRRKSANMPKGFVWPPSAQMKAIGASCSEALTATGIAFVAATKKQVAAEARMVTPVIMDEMKFGDVNWSPTYRKPPFIMDCHLALALYRVSPALAALGVHTVYFSRIYEFSRVRAYGRSSRAISRHALGLAIDVRKVEGVETLPDDGGDVSQLVTVQDDYHRSAWLRAVEATLNSSGLFRTVLGPENDPKSHYDHFHIEAAASFAP